MTSAPSTTPTRSEAAGADKTHPALRFLRVWGTIIVMIAVAIGFSFASPYFMTVSNMNNIVFSMFTSALLSIGLTYVVTAGSFDLSIGITVTTVSIVCAMFIPITGAPIAIVIALLAAAAIGLVNGVLVTYLRISGIVATIGVMFLLEGVNQYMTGGYQIAISYEDRKSVV